VSIPTDIHTMLHILTCCWCCCVVCSTVRNNGRTAFPPGIKATVTVAGTTITYRNGNKSSEMNKFPYKQLLAADTSEIIANLKSEIDLSMREIEEATRTEEGLRRDREQADKAFRALESQVVHIWMTDGWINRLHFLTYLLPCQIRKLNSDISGCRRAKSDLQTQLSDIEAAEKADVQLLSLEAELDELKGACDQIKRTLADVDVKLAECVAESKVIQVGHGIYMLLYLRSHCMEMCK
jgi:septal ring factor EnvC (AmiA/AmiB activator)